MPKKMIQIRHVPDSVHRVAKARAAMAGMSLSEYLLREITILMERPTMEEVLSRLDKQPPVSTSLSAADILREEREAR
jgi:plasmid stability protein